MLSIVFEQPVTLSGCVNKSYINENRKTLYISKKFAVFLIIIVKKIYAEVSHY